MPMLALSSDWTEHSFQMGTRVRIPMPQLFSNSLKIKRLRPKREKIGLPSRVTQTVKTLIAVRCKILDGRTTVQHSEHGR